MNRIGDYAVLGDCHSAALVGRDGSIDWACFPRFDSRALFSKILDPERGGAFRVDLPEVRRSTRAYLPDTNVLVTTFEGPSGVADVTDCMPVARLDTGSPTQVASCRAILRRIRCTDGHTDVRLDLAPRFEYGSFVPRFRLTSPYTAEIVGGADALVVRATQPLEGAPDRIGAQWRLLASQEAWVEVSWSRSYEVPSFSADPQQLAEEFRRRLDDTIRFWRGWMSRCWYRGEWEGPVRRSALALKALTFAPSGAVVAAATTSLPEQIGGIRNWDYRYTWIRDATLTLIALFTLGFTDEAAAFKRWIEQVGAGRPQDLQIMYGVGGERFLPEIEQPQLSGHRGSRPVRIGNAAVKQIQLDAYGQLLEAGYLWAKSGGAITATNWNFLAGLADIVCARWRMPDHGIWEIRAEPRHFLHSKLNCWIALDRAVRIATRLGLPGPVQRWADERDAIRAYVLDAGAACGWFPQAVGFEVPDASTLLVPASGLVSSNDPLVEATIARVRAALGSEREGLFYRYTADDGLPGNEGVFLLCSFWLLDCLTHAGRLDEAEALLERLLAVANDVGLYSEAFDPASGEALGNFPQAFSHMALVSSCAHLTAAKRGEIPKGAHDYAELALDRLLARYAAEEAGGRDGKGETPA